MSLNTLRNASIDSDSANFWLSTKDGFDVRGASIRTRSLSFFGSILGREALLAMSILGRESGVTTELDQMSKNMFESPNLENGDMIIVLSSTEAVEILNPRVVNGSILVVAQMPTELLGLFATQLRVAFTPSEYGVYSKVFRPGNHFLTVIRNRLRLLTGVLKTFGAIHGIVLGSEDFPVNRQEPVSSNAVQNRRPELASPNTVQSLERQWVALLMTLMERAIRIATMALVVLPCGYRFHSSCVEEWLLKQPNSCPLCRGGISSKDVTNENASTEETIYSETADSEEIVNKTSRTDGDH